jgi:hypothetical protein
VKRELFPFPNVAGALDAGETTALEIADVAQLFGSEWSARESDLGHAWILSK